MTKIDARGTSSPRIFMNPNLRKTTPAAIIGKITSPPPRIAKLTLISFFLFSFRIFLIFNLIPLDIDGMIKPPKIFNLLIWYFAIFCITPECQTAQIS